LGLAASALIVSAFVAAFDAKPKTQTEKSHPLTGSLQKRISLFSRMAEHSSVDRPPRRGDDEGAYVPAPNGGASV
jgi:hypothetical protein